MTASDLRQNIYRVLDRVLETGTPVVIERKGRRLRIVPEEVKGKLDRLIQTQPVKDYLLCDAEEIVHLDWSDEWHQ